MARIRSVKPEFWLDRKLARRLTRDERMLYMGLWNQADEHGRALADPVVVKGAVFPYDDDLTTEVIDRMLWRLDETGVVQRYEVEGDPYLFLPKLKDHQRLEPGKSRSKHPEPPERGASHPDPDVVSDQSEKIIAESETISVSRREPVPESGNGFASFEPDQQQQSDPGTATIFSDESAHDPGKKSLLYGTGSMEQGGAAQIDPRETENPPKPHCEKHPGGTPDACGACAGARKRWVAHNLERDQRATAAAAEKNRAGRERTRRAAEDRARAAASCRLCDDDGYLHIDSDDGPQVSLCAHDSGETGKRGRAEFQRELARMREKRTPAPTPEELERIRTELATAAAARDCAATVPEAPSSLSVAPSHTERAFAEEPLTTEENTTYA
ncbi:hypothetical protein ACIP5Y_21215 [Nocardia sp. NPDC088792]|uniref:hypothetical protein n=1 Tax=Nocardia sp. NPDC088792 TaxID=3364332 RepID=UPI003820CEF3